VAASWGKAKKKTTPAKKAAQPPKKAAKPKAEGSREGSKTAKILDMLKRSGGATAKELMKATGWQSHSLRGFEFAFANGRRVLPHAESKWDTPRRIDA